MARRLYVCGLALASISVVYGFYILASRDEIIPFQDNSDGFINVPEEYKENLPEFDVLPAYEEPGLVEEEDVDDGEDEAELLDRTLRLRDIIQNKQEALRLAQEYNQMLGPEDFAQRVQADDPEQVEFIPVPRRRAVYLIDE
ncbi:unnamed protein product [Bursaphelenchus okinawaensis]|uniref:Uncharacterized protein n=1 Tax=Bursaphelenchus okinawaensis TaxID=465554 RepID=A0A811L933_9BILA|nr:unnamed protein product [Bursaphelenchus okinawaensis]CAG9120139.1 unnamed protein product [Bursaphelenchus okinawaensis]